MSFRFAVFLKQIAWLGQLVSSPLALLLKSRIKELPPPDASVGNASKMSAFTTSVSSLGVRTLEALSKKIHRSPSTPTLNIFPQSHPPDQSYMTFEDSTLTSTAPIGIESPPRLPVGSGIPLYSVKSCLWTVPRLEGRGGTYTFDPFYKEWTLTRKQESGSSCERNYCSYYQIDKLQFPEKDPHQETNRQSKLSLESKSY